MKTEDIISMLETSKYKEEPITQDKPSYKHYQLLVRSCCDMFTINSKRRWIILSTEKEVNGDIRCVFLSKRIRSCEYLYMGKGDSEKEIKSLIKDKILCGK